MNGKKSGLIKNLIFVFGITFLAKISGFIREMVYGSQLGVSSLSDNFVMAQTIPVTLYAVVTQAFRTTYIPNLFRVKQNEGDKAGEAYTGNYICFVMVASIIMFVFLYAFAKPLTLVFAGGFSEADIHQTVEITRIISITVLFGGLIDLLNGYLQSHGYYNVGASLTIFSNGVFCTFLMLYPIMGVPALLLASVLSKVTELLIIASAVIYRKLNIQFLNWKYWKYTTSAFKDSIPVLLGSVITDLGNLIDKRFATQLIGGTVSALNYANKVQLMIVQLFSATIGAVLFPELSRISNDKNAFSKTINTGLRYIILIMVPISIGTICASSNFISVLFQRGAFDEYAVKFTCECLIFYAPAMVFTVCYEFLSKACFAIHDTKTPIIMSAIGMIVNVIFNFLLIEKFTHRGLAFATTLSMFIAFVGVFLVLNKNYKMEIRRLSLLIVKIAIACAFMGLAVVFVGKYLLINKYVKLCIQIMVGIIAYFSILVVLRTEELKALIEIFLGKVRKAK